MNAPSSLHGPDGTPQPARRPTFLRSSYYGWTYGRAILALLVAAWLYVGLGRRAYEVQAAVLAQFPQPTGWVSHVRATPRYWFPFDVDDAVLVQYWDGMTSVLAWRPLAAFLLAAAALTLALAYSVRR